MNHNQPCKIGILPVVSAIIIFFNEEKFLEEAIVSVIEQTYPHWELLLVDDGSNDNSTLIAQDYAQKYPDKIYYLEHDQHQNLGMSASRNLGISHAQGKYIAYLDGDDVWLAQKLERQVEILQSQPEAVMVYGQLLLWYSWTGNPEDREKDQLYGLQTYGIHLKGDTLIQAPKLLNLFIRYKQLIPAGILIEKQAIEDVGGYEEIFRGNYEDAVLLVKVCLKSTVFVSNECWYKYRQHPDCSSKITKKAGQSNTTQLFFLNWAKQYFSEQGVTDNEVWQALESAFFPHHHPKLYQLQQSYYWLINKLENEIIKIGRSMLPEPTRQWLWNQWINFKVKIK